MKLTFDATPKALAAADHLLVLAPSASGESRARRIGVRAEDGHHVGGASHFALLNHPAVAEKLVAWLSAPAGRRAAA